MILTTFEIESNLDSRVTARFGGQWMRFGNSLAILHAHSPTAPASTIGSREYAQHKGVDHKSLFVVGQKGRLFQKENPDIQILLDKGRYLLVQISDAARLQEILEHKEPCYAITPWSPGKVVYSARVRSTSGREGRADWITNLVDKVTAELYLSLIHI